MITEIISIEIKLDQALPSTTAIPFSGIIDDPDQNTTTLIDNI